MPRFKAIFIDNGDVMMNNQRRAAEWRRLIGEFLTPRLGATPEAWADANQVIFERQWQRFLAWLDSRDPLEWGDFFAENGERVRWLREMCEYVGVAAPRDCDALALETQQYVIPRVKAAHDGAPDAIETLHRRGYALYTASGDPSWDLHHSLIAMETRHCFGERLYGPDLVRVLKGGPLYYERILSDAGVAPEQALVVDNDVRAIAWAAEAGAATVLVTSARAEGSSADHVVERLADLPAWLED
jgi:phosphoglycolate phosphatase-like HAD superfamily hydrolase